MKMKTVAIVGIVSAVLLAIVVTVVATTLPSGADAAAVPPTADDKVQSILSEFLLKGTSFLECCMNDLL
jgi:hypothetical protein